MLADDATQSAVELACLRAEGGVAEALGQGGGVNDVYEEDCCHAGRGSWFGAGARSCFGGPVFGGLSIAEKFIDSREN